MPENCGTCKWFDPGDDFYGESTMQKSYPAHCNYKHNMSNLKGFPFSSKLKCFTKREDIRK